MEPLPRYHRSVIRRHPPGLAKSGRPLRCPSRTLHVSHERVSFTFPNCYAVDNGPGSPGHRVSCLFRSRPLANVSHTAPAGRHLPGRAGRANRHASPGGAGGAGPPPGGAVSADRVRAGRGGSTAAGWGPRDSGCRASRRGRAAPGGAHPAPDAVAGAAGTGHPRGASPGFSDAAGHGRLRGATGVGDAAGPGAPPPVSPGLPPASSVTSPGRQHKRLVTGPQDAGPVIGRRAPRGSRSRGPGRRPAGAAIVCSVTFP